MRQGEGLLAIWLDVPSESNWWNATHSREKMPGRLGLPGVKRARRYEETREVGRYFLLYEAESPQVFASEEYLAAVNRPGERGVKVGGLVQNFVRGACEIVAAEGQGVGGHLGTLTVDVDDAISAPEAWADRLVRTCGINERASLLTGIAIGVRDDDISDIPSAERDLRQSGDDGRFSTAVLVEGMSSAAVRDALHRIRSASNDYLHPMSNVWQHQYHLLHAIDRADL